MPKIRQRDPNDKIKTKGKKHSGSRKKKTNAARQIQTAVDQKVKQRRENEASNEYAVSTSEQAVVDTVIGAAELTGKTANFVYDKAIRQCSPTQDAGSDTNTEDGSYPASYCEPSTAPEDIENPVPTYADQGRNLAVQEYAESHYGKVIQSPVPSPTTADISASPGVQPKAKPVTDYEQHSVPKGRDTVPSKSVNTPVEMGRKHAIQTRAESILEQQQAPYPYEAVPGPPSATHTGTSIHTNVTPKTRPATNYGNKVLPKTKDTALQPSGNAAVDQGRKLAVQKYAQKKTETAALEKLDYPETTSPADSSLYPRVKPQDCYDPQVLPKQNGYTTRVPGTDLPAVPEGQIDPFMQAKSSHGHSGDIPPALRTSPEATDVASAAPDVKTNIKMRQKGNAAPKQKPKSAPKTRNAVEVLSPRTVRPEKINRTATALTPAQKASEMGRRKFMKEAQRQLAIQAQKAAKATADLAKKAANALLKAIQATISMLAGIFGGVGIAVILMGILLIGAILASPFGILFSNEPADGAIPLSYAVAQISMEFSTKLNELQEGDYENITIDGEPPEWIEVIAVFACHIAGGDDGVDVMVLDAEKVDKLRTVFWDMCVITVEEETEVWTGPTTPTDVSTTPTVNLTITIEPKTADQMRLLYSFSESQNDALTDLLAEDEMLNSLVGDLDVSQGDALEVLNGIPGDVSETRKAVVRQALTLVGKVNYFWGGKSLVIGWDNRWGQPTEVWAAGSPTTGTIRPYGLDCSGFVDWVFYNVSGGSYVMGHGGGVATQHVYCQDIPWDQAQPGDLIFYPDDSHAGIVGGWDDAGNMQVIHCASGSNNVVITGTSGFSTIGRPYFYGE